jgi:hypothetical protein
MRVLGIDPGACGGLALIEDGRLLEALPMPSERQACSGKRRINATRLSHAVRSWVAELPIDVAYIELVGPMPRDGSAGSFWFGMATGLAHGVCAGLGLRTEVVAPAVWKRRLDVPSDKRKARDRASSLFKAGSTRWWPRLKDDGLAEAAMIGLYGYQKERAGPKGIIW